ncbi:MAG TPA: glutamine synthetase family protein [Candidatus Dormibacteraeota bacterium]|nr:glutamine synthetase family protein [Candidatus Dormibacteraeota bacterium]
MVAGDTRSTERLNELRARVTGRAEADGLRLVRFLYCDLDGVIRGKATGLSSLGERLETGIGLTVAMQAFSMLDHLADVEGMGPVGEIRLVPDPETFVVAPYAPHVGLLLVDMLDQERRPYEADGRHFLRRMSERAARLGLNIVAAFEPEWTLARRSLAGEWEPFDDSLCFSSDGMTAAADVIDDVVAALEGQGLPVEQYYPELGWGQQELSIRHAAALRAADNHLLYRETVRAVAHRRGLRASFAPKPWPGQPGNGCHLHLSAWDEHGANRFAEPGAPHGLSALGLHFMAGVLDHLPGLLGLTCPSVNSYRRLQPQTWASAYRAWGPDNREAAVRLASPFWGHEAESTNFELKACDSTANPYVALGGVIAAGLDGVGRELEPPPPLLVDPHTMDAQARARAGAVRHPGSLGEAIQNLKADRVLLEALGGRLSTAYLAVKESDIEGLATEDETLEYSSHRFRF